MKMFIIDVIFNLLISLYTCYNVPTILPIFYSAAIIWIINDTLLYNNYINETTSEILHAMAVHIPGMYSIVEDVKRIENIPH
jgi:hypothetical protein